MRSPSNSKFSSCFGLELLDVGCGRIVDRDPARLHGFRYLSSQLDLEQAIVEPCSLDPDVVSQIEMPREGPRRDAPIEEIPLILRIAAFDDEHVLLSCYRDFIGGETGQCRRYPVPVVGQNIA